MPSLDDLLKEKNIFYLKERMVQNGINNTGDLERIINDQKIFQMMEMTPPERMRIKVIIKNIKSEEEKNKFCKNDYNKSSSCSSVDETDIIYESMNEQDEEMSSQTFKMNKGNYIAARQRPNSQYDANQYSNSNHDKGGLNFIQTIAECPMSSLDDLLKEKDIFYLKERMVQNGINKTGDLERIINDQKIFQMMEMTPLERMKIKVIIKNIQSEEEKNKFCKNDYNKSSSCSSVDETEIIYESMNEQDEEMSSQTFEMNKGNCIARRLKKNKILGKNIDKNSSKQKEVTNKVQKYTPPQIPGYPDSCQKANPKDHQYMNLMHDKTEKLDFSSFDETNERIYDIIYDTIDEQDVEMKSQMFEMDKGNYIANKSTYEYQPPPRNLPRIKSEMHNNNNNGNPIQRIHSPQNKCQSSIYPDSKKKQDSNSQSEQLGQRTQRSNSQYDDINQCSKLDHNKCGLNSIQTGELLNKLKLRKNKTQRENVDKISSKQNEVTKKELPQHEYCDISDVQKYTLPQIPRHPDSCQKANPKDHQYMNLMQDKPEKLDFSSFDETNERIYDIIYDTIDEQDVEMKSQTFEMDKGNYIENKSTCEYQRPYLSIFPQQRSEIRNYDESIYEQDEEMNSQTFEINKGNYIENKGTYEYQGHPKKFPQLKSEMHNKNNGNPSQRIHSPQNKCQSSIYPDSKKKQDSNSQSEQLGQRTQRSNSQYDDINQCSKLDHNKCGLNSIQTGELLNKLKLRKSKTQRENVDKISSKQNEVTKKELPQHECCDISDVQKYTLPQIPRHPDSCQKANPKDQQYMNLIQDKISNQDNFFQKIDNRKMLKGDAKNMTTNDKRNTLKYYLFLFFIFCIFCVIACKLYITN